MNPKVTEVISEIKGSDDILNSKVDIYLSGSVSRNEIRTSQEGVLSDMDLVIVFKDRNDAEKAGRSLKKIADKHEDDVKISIIFCKFDNFVKSALADYVLSIDLTSPIVKGIDYEYDNFRDKELHKDRWIYQMQSVVFYFCKYMISSKDQFLCKCYHSILRAELYRNGKVRSNNYILLNEIEDHLDESEKGSFRQSKERLLESAPTNDEIIENIRTYVVNMITGYFNADTTERMESILNSVRSFGSLLKMHGGLIFEPDEYKIPMKAVMAENLGIDDISIIDYN